MARTWQETALLALIVIVVFPLLDKWTRKVSASDKRIDNGIRYALCALAVLLGLAILLILVNAIANRL